MTPTLAGRIQTRWLLLAVVGVPWTILLAPFAVVLLGAPGLGDFVVTAFGVLLLVGVLGTLWELAYHGLQQLRWEKDWPTIFGLVTVVNELLLVLVVLALLEQPVGAALVVHFLGAWLWMWLVANGPMRVLLPRWRYQGGRVL